MYVSDSVQIQSQIRIQPLDSLFFTLYIEELFLIKRCLCSYLDSFLISGYS